MTVKNLVVVDFETKGIEARPAYPPEPVGFAIRFPGKRSRYYAWGHPIENNCTKEQAQQVLRDVFKDTRYSLLFHNAKFDVDVACTHMGCSMPDWRRIHDTLFQVFLDDPHQRSLSLKPSAERILGLPPDEQEAVRDWLYDHGVVKRGAKDWGANIADAPGKLVGTYAVGDVDRTYELFKVLTERVSEAGMTAAYDRERQLMPILLANEIKGIRVDADGLERDIIKYRKNLERAEAWIRKTLGVPDLNIDSDRNMAAALEAAGVVTEFVLTESGQKSVSKKNLTPDRFNDPRVAAALGYRNRLITCLNMFMVPWHTMAVNNGGYIHTNWNQVRQSGSGGGNVGARTGRMSCSPNFMNIPKSFEDKGDGYVHPKFLRVDPLPLVRHYVLPDPGQTFVHRDFNQQELRILAHFEDDKLLSEYNEKPRMDIHDFVKNMIHEMTGIELTRSATKIMNFGLVYGMGIGKLAEDMGIEVDVAKRVKAGQRAALPGLKNLEEQIKKGAKRGEPIVTWGGRLYYTEPPMKIKGRTVTFEYKLLNYLIQGSAADCSKQAIINYDQLKKDSRFLVAVHDEINISATNVKREMKLLREAMEGVQFDIPMLSDGKTGDRWGSVTKYEEK